MSEKKETILFVDDEQSILEISEDYFLRKGYKVLTAENGVEAVEVLKNNEIDCCFTDLNMPEMDGLEFAECVRKFDNTIPVIIMTGFPSMDNIIKTLKNGVVDFLIKPINLKNMEVCVKRVMRERKLFVENIILSKELEGKAKIEELNRELLYKVEELNALINELNILNKIMEGFTSVNSGEEMFRHLVTMGVQVVQAEEMRFYLINEEMECPYEVAFAFDDQVVVDLDGGVEIKEADFVRGVAYEQEKKLIDCLIMENVKDEVPFLLSDNSISKIAGEQIKSLMIVPLKIRKKIFGILTGTIRTGTRKFVEMDLYYLSFIAQRAAYAIENIALYENIYENLFSTLYAFVAALEAKDSYTEQHSNRVAELSIMIGREFGCSTEELEILNFAGRLHDIGKIGIRDDILLKQGKLTDEEFAEIKKHPVIGANIVSQLGLWNRERKIIKHHHERFDGQGYPDGLLSDDIPLLARILSVADSYDAMASDRAYRKKMDSKKIISIIKDCSGTQFDPEIVDVFLKIFESGKIQDV